jgi:hypothetical protein
MGDLFLKQKSIAAVGKDAGPHQSLLRSNHRLFPEDCDRTSAAT